MQLKLNVNDTISFDYKQTGLTYDISYESQIEGVQHYIEIPNGSNVLQKHYYNPSENEISLYTQQGNFVLEYTKETVNIDGVDVSFITLKDYPEFKLGDGLPIKFSTRQTNNWTSRSRNKKF